MKPIVMRVLGAGRSAPMADAETTHGAPSATVAPLKKLRRVIPFSFAILSLFLLGLKSGSVAAILAFVAVQFNTNRARRPPDA
jgi:hypothetical protein